MMMEHCLYSLGTLRNTEVEHCIELSGKPYARGNPYIQWCLWNSVDCGRSLSSNYLNNKRKRLEWFGAGYS